MSGRIEKVTIANGDTLSTEIDINGDGVSIRCAVAGVESPDAVDGTDGYLEYSRDGGVSWCGVYPAGTRDVIKIAAADGDGVRHFCPVIPGYYFGLGTKLRFRAVTAQTDDREFGIVLAEIAPR